MVQPKVLVTAMADNGERLKLLELAIGERLKLLELAMFMSHGQEARMMPDGLVNSRRFSRPKWLISHCTSMMASPAEPCGARRWPIIW